MNKFKQRKNVYPQAHQSSMHHNQSKENQRRSDPGSPRLPKLNIAMENAYASLRRISEECNVPCVEKTFGKGIVRVSCKNIIQLENIAPVTKEVLKSGLIEEIGMQPLSYSCVMKNLVLFFKPTHVASSRNLRQMYSLTSFGYQHLVLDVEHPVDTKGLYKSKRIAVKNAYYSLRQLLNEFNIPCVNGTFGSGIVRVCCRSVVQLDNFTLIMKELLELHLIEEVGICLEYNYKMKTLVVFLNPPNIQSTKKLDQFFKNCCFKYHHLILAFKNPTDTVAPKEKFKAYANSFFEIPMESIWWIIIRVVMIISIPILIYRTSSRI